ncbi:MAG: sensor histidine kinase [Planctomycetota bacterium]|jgi:signal transduction histidine kinase
MEWWYLLAGAALAGPICAATALWASRRAWRNARKLAARAKGHKQLVEVGQLTGGLAHEIKNPLSTINVNLKLLAEDIGRSEDETHRRWLRRIKNVQEEADRVRGILDDFLRFAGKYELNLATLDLRQLIDELADFFGPQAQAAGVVMRTALPESELLCRADANLIKQALLNLMINAVDEMGKGGELLIKLSAEHERAIVEVIDTGPGIGSDDLERIFQAYYSSKQSGTGLGLPTSRRIIREHGGTIRVESVPGSGTRFIITLPLAKP